MTRALVVPAVGRGRVAEITANGSARLRELQAIVGGYVEAVSGADTDWHAYVNDSGLIDGLTPNVPATTLCYVLGVRVGLLHGAAVFLGDNGPREADLPKYVLDIASALMGAAL